MTNHETDHRERQGPGWLVEPPFEYGPADNLAAWRAAEKLLGNLVDLSRGHNNLPHLMALTG
jgi:hypothetical protein